MAYGAPVCALSSIIMGFSVFSNELLGIKLFICKKFHVPT